MNDSPDGGDGGDGFPRSPDPAGGDDSTVSVETLFEILTKPRCRFVLSHFETSSADVAELDDVADYVVDREAGAESGDVVDRRLRVAVALHHRHLPRLAETSVLDYDPRSKTIRYWGDDRIAACLDAVRRAEEP